MPGRKQQKVKIAVFHNLPLGGGFRVMQQMIDHLSLSKYQVDLYQTTEEQIIKNERYVTGVNKTTDTVVKPWPGFILRNLWIIFILPRIHKRLAVEIDKGGYKLVLIHHDYFTKSPYLLTYLKTKKIYVLHEPQREYYESWDLHAPTFKDKVANIIRYPIKIIDAHNGRNADLIISNSEYSHKIIRRVYRRNSMILYPGIDTQIFRPSKAIKKNIILVVGRVSRVKGQDFILKALQYLLGDYKLYIVGTGRNEEMSRIYKAAGDKRKYIKVIENLSEQDLVKLYQIAKVHCIGAYREPFGMTSIESQACGTPVVAINEGGIEETIINNVTGMLANRDMEDFLNKTLITLKSWRKMRKNARINAMKFSTRQQRRKFNEIISKYASKKTPS